MRRFPSLAKRIISDQRGATAVEYGLIIALIFLAIVASIAGVADATISMWRGVESNVSTAMNGNAQ
ncbi:Flp family type IVb pilin [Sphingomonas sp. 37zxx]|uniref:Flp family type IVb pilin n=1 Tax=Sphingomonas sp. 37zxx TaxID=1550073 RepID=UPI00053BF5ED|nr:Flp family type IVb pilin [Sphingomonas sp. 37zxx]